MQRALQQEVKQGGVTFSSTQFSNSWHLLLAEWVWGHASVWRSPNHRRNRNIQEITCTNGQGGAACT